MSGSLISKRTKGLVALCKSADNHDTASNDIIGSPFPTGDYPLSPWWDGIFEANDINNLAAEKSKLLCHPVEAVKRRLLFSSDKLPDVMTADVESSPLCEDELGTSLTPIKAILPLCAQKQIGCLVKDQVIEDNFYVSDGTKFLPQSTILLCYKDSSNLSQDSSNLNLVSESNNKDRKISPQTLVVTNAESKRSLGQANLTPNAVKKNINVAGKRKGPHAMPATCKEACNRCEFPRFSEEERQNISKYFWGLGSHEAKWLFIFQSIETHSPKRKFSVAGVKGEKLTSRVYYLTVDDNRRKVCKTMFKSTLIISDSWINSALTNCTAEGLVSMDMRGKWKRTNLSK